MPDDNVGPDGGPELTSITLKIPETFLEDLEATWRAEDFQSRSGFIRWALRDAVKHPSFTRSAWKDIATSEHQLRTGDGRVYSSDEIRAGLIEDANDGE